MKHYTICCIIIAAVIIFFGSSAVMAEEQDGEDLSGELISGYSELYGEQIEGGAGEIINQSITPYANGMNIGEFIKRVASGEVPLNPIGIVKELLSALFGEMLGVTKNMLLVVAMVILSSVLSAVVTGFEKNETGKIAYYVCFIAVAGLASSTFYSCLEGASAAIENLTLFMRCIVPIMITALLSSGAIVSATSLEPVLLTVIEAALTLIKSIFMPLVMVGTGLGTINALSANLKTTRLVSLINNTVKYGLSVLLTVFVAFAGLQSIASGADALTLKLTKFASSNLIPVVGGILSESVETVLNCSSVIKNSVGVVGVILVFFIAVMPIVNIIAAMLTFRLVAAFCEPIAHKSLVECISCMANGISMVFSMLVSVSVMFIIIITVMINIST
ncbi:MAG: stage III sporulation protein AE [Monoglobus pectinilyticus]|uniref:stage III sporulation protein AE n=1 Tax=Monoglobus pectinilyticus TaxID=1981510 RepID=UPI0039A33815